MLSSQPPSPLSTFNKPKHSMTHVSLLAATLYYPHLQCQAESRVCYYAPTARRGRGLPTAQAPHLTRSSTASERLPPGPHLIQPVWQTPKNTQHLGAVSLLHEQCWSGHHLVSSQPMQRPYNTYPVLVQRQGQHKVRDGCTTQPQRPHDMHQSREQWRPAAPLLLPCLPRQSPGRARITGHPNIRFFAAYQPNLYLTLAPLTTHTR